MKPTYCGDAGDERRPSVRTPLEMLADRYGLPPAAPEQFEAVLRLLAAEPAALTTVRDLVEAVDRHVADSLSGLETEEARTARTIADLGSGSGFPGIALAIARPDAQVALVESVGRKCAFLSRAVAAAAVENTVVVCARAEEWDDGLARQDLITARALASLPTLVEYAAPLLRLGGALVAWKGQPEVEEEVAGNAAAHKLGMELRDVVQVQPFPQAARRRLYIYRKIAPTPSGFPRRPGIAHKRPLSSPGRR